MGRTDPGHLARQPRRGLGSGLLGRAATPLAAAVLLASCDGGGDAAQVDIEGAAEPAQVAPVDGVDDPTSNEPAQPPPPPAPAPIDQVLATATGSGNYPGLAINTFRREGEVVRLNFTLDVDKLGQESLYTRDVFSRLEDHDLPVNSDDRAQFSGITLVDDVNRNRHLVLRDSDDQCLCTRFPSFFLGRDYPQTLQVRGSALFAAPPADVTTMTIVFPQFGSIELGLEGEAPAVAPPAPSPTVTQPPDDGAGGDGGGEAQGSGTGDTESTP